jgi:hypothetical protein
MPFVAECIFCHRKLRAPDHAVGWSVPCPRCGNSFTLVASADGAPASDAVLPPLAEPGPIVAAATRPLPQSAPPAPVQPRRISPLGAAAFCLGSLALVSASLPLLDALTVPLAGAGAVLGLLGITFAQGSGRGMLLPALGSLVSVPVLVLGLLWPTVLNPTRMPGGATSGPDGGQLLAIPIGKEEGRPAGDMQDPEWVDAGKESVQQGDVRVRVVSAVVKTPELRQAPAGVARSRCLLIGIRVYNIGAERRIEYASWGEAPSDPATDQPELRDNAGRLYPLHSFGPAASIVGHVRRAGVKPASFINDVLAFEPVATDVEYLRLELPAAACGGTGKLRFQIPRWMLGSR